jgi:hypothetical protein
VFLLRILYFLGVSALTCPGVVRKEFQQNLYIKFTPTNLCVTWFENTCQAKNICNEDVIYAALQRTELCNNWLIVAKEQTAVNHYMVCVVLALCQIQKGVRMFLLLFSTRVLLIVLLLDGIAQGVPSTTTILWSTVRPHLSTKHSWFIYQTSLTVTSWHT